MYFMYSKNGISQICNRPVSQGWSDVALQFLKILASVAPVSYRPVSYKKNNVYDENSKVEIQQYKQEIQSKNDVEANFLKNKETGTNLDNSTIISAISASVVLKKNFDHIIDYQHE